VPDALLRSELLCSQLRCSLRTGLWNLCRSLRHLRSQLWRTLRQWMHQHVHRRPRLHCQLQHLRPAGDLRFGVLQQLHIGLRLQLRFELLTLWW